MENNSKKLIITGILNIGDSRRGTLTAAYDEIVAAVGADNVTHLDDTDKVPASWAFKDQNGRKGFIWAYRLPKDEVKTNNYWSIDGDKSLLEDLFPGKVF